MPVFSVVIVPPWRKVPKTQEGGNTEAQRTQKGAADGYGLNVATCRQTVEALLAPLSTAWQRMATLGCIWLRINRSHLSPDGGHTLRGLL